MSSAKHRSSVYSERQPVGSLLLWPVYRIAVAAKPNTAAGRIATAGSVYRIAVAAEYRNQRKNAVKYKQLVGSLPLGSVWNVWREATHKHVPFCRPGLRSWLFQL